MRKLLPIIIIVVVVLTALLLSKRKDQVRVRPQGPVVAVDFLTASFGNSVVFTMPDGRALVVDPAGPTATRRLVDYLRQAGISSIDVLLTRPGSGSEENLQRLFEAFEVRRVIHQGLPWPRPLEGPGGQIAEVLIYGGDSVRLCTGLRLIALSPLRESEHSENLPLVTCIQYGKTRFLLMSDANAEDEGYLIRSGQDLASDVLVIGRNGRLGRTSLELLFAVKPRHCIVLAGSGANRPSRGLLERIDGKNTGANVYRTDIHGIIKMISDGNVVTVVQ